MCARAVKKVDLLSERGDGMQYIGWIIGGCGVITGVAAVWALIYHSTRNKVTAENDIRDSKEKLVQVGTNKEAIADHEKRIKTLETSHTEQLKLLKEMRDESRRADDFIKETLQKILNSLIEGGNSTEELKKTRDGIINARLRT